MFFLSNFLSSFVDNFNYYYNNLTDESKLVFYIIIILMIIVVILIFILFNQRDLNVKVIEKIEPADNDNFFNTDELLNVTEEDNEKTRNLKEISDKIQEVIDKRNVDLTKFEQDQEENSIISYKELLNKVGQNKPEYVEEEFELPDLAKKIEVNEMVDREKEENKTVEVGPLKEEKFKNSEFISPIFGRQGFSNSSNFNNKVEKNVENEIEYLFTEEENNIENDTYLDEEKFLMSLREFRNNLD